MTNSTYNKVLIVSAHPDDEVLGAAGVIQKHIQSGDQVCIAFVTNGFYENPTVDLIELKHTQAKKSASILGVSDVQFFNQLGLNLDTIPKCQLNGILTEFCNQYKPNIIYTHHWGDINHDHLVVFDMVMVASRPHRKTFVEKIYLFETLSSTEWNGKASNSSFIPNTFSVLSQEHIEKKKEAFSCYESEVFDYPHPRSLSGIEYLARYRGLNVSSEYAEAFYLVREVDRLL